MKTKFAYLSLIFVLVLSMVGLTQSLPAKIETHLSTEYFGWRMSPSTKDCGWEVNPGFVSGFFNGDRKRDYAVKITQGKKGFVLAFLATKYSYKPFVIHDTDSNDVSAMSIFIQKRGTTVDYLERDLRLEYDAFADFRCESDIGGFHFFRNGKFLAT